MMKNIFSVGIRLDNIVKSTEIEQNILRKLAECKKISGKMFKVIFWHENLTEKQCKDFIKRNQKILFDFNSEITKDPKNLWFWINSGKNNFIHRYKYEGDIIDGLNVYLKIVNHMKKRDGI